MRRLNTYNSTNTNSFSLTKSSKVSVSRELTNSPLTYSSAAYTNAITRTRSAKRDFWIDNDMSVLWCVKCEEQREQ